nr:ShlB/FhaC/HecB family hemolysin secretion/activation protein [Bradyrhizobium sp.]
MAPSTGSTQPRLDPRQTERNFDAFEAAQKRTGRAPIPIPDTARPQVKYDTKPLFKLTGASVTGARSISSAAIAATYQPYIGKTVSETDLAAITSKISDLYRDAGFHLSRAVIPPQEVENGRIRIQVIEGAIAEIVLKGERAEQFGVRPLLAAIAAEHPSRLQTLERHLLLVNDIPGVRIADTALVEIGGATGRFRLTIHLETWRGHLALGTDNRGTRSVGPWQSYWSSSLNSAIVAGDTFGINLSTIPNTPRELGFGRVMYDAPVGASGARLGASAAYSEIRPGDERRLLNTNTRVESYEIRGSIVPWQTRETALRLTAAANLNNVTEQDSLGVQYDDKIRTVSLAADHQFKDALNGTNYLNVTLRQGLNIFGASRAGDALLSRDDGSGNFSKVEFSHTRLQKLSETWSLRISASGQAASRALLASQEFYLGGAAFGRGFDNGTVSGDNGLAGVLELRFDQKLNHDFFKSYQLYGFIDSGVVWNFHDGADDVYSLTSAGAGVRIFLAHELLLGAEVAVPLAIHAPTDVRRGPRAIFFLSKAFKFCPDNADMACSRPR